MKNSTILIIVGIAIVVIGIGIAFMNTAQAENKSTSTYPQTGTQQLITGLEEKYSNHGFSIPAPVSTTVAIIVFGMIVLAGGLYDARRTPSTGNTKRPGPI